MPRGIRSIYIQNYPAPPPQKKKQKKTKQNRKQKQVKHSMYDKKKTTMLTTVLIPGNNSGGWYHEWLATFSNSFMSPSRIAIPDDSSMLCRISVLGEAAPSDKLRQMLKPSNGGAVEASLIP